MEFQITIVILDIKREATTHFLKKQNQKKDEFYCSYKS